MILDKISQPPKVEDGEEPIPVSCFTDGCGTISVCLHFLEVIFLKPLAPLVLFACFFLFVRLLMLQGQYMALVALRLGMITQEIFEEVRDSKDGLLTYVRRGRIPSALQVFHSIDLVPTPH